MTGSFRKAERILPWVVIPLAVLLVYQPVISGGLLMDDAEHITPPALRSFAGLARIWFQIGATPHYYPLLNSAFWLEHRLGGDSPVFYHVANLVQHAGAACVLVMLVRRLRLPGALLAGLLFAIHPVQVESVAWISEQKNTLSALLALSAAWFYFGYLETRSRVAYGVASGFFLLALLTKTVVAVVPPAILVVGWWQKGRVNWRREVLPLVPWFVVGAALGLFSAWFERVHSHAEGASFQLTLLERLLIAGRAVWFYARTLAWPSDLMFINPRWTVSVTSAADYAAVVLVGLVCVTLVLATRKSRGPLAAFLLYVGMLFPVLGWFNINWFNFSFVADHFQYLPSIGLIVPFAAWFHTRIGRLRGISRIKVAAQGLLVIAVGWAARAHSQEYRSPESLYLATIEKNPECWLAYNNLGVLLMDRPGELKRARGYFQQALVLKPDHARAHNNLATALVRSGALPEALVHFRRSLELQEAVPEVHLNYGLALLAAGDRTQHALDQFNRAIELKPDYVEAQIARADALSAMPDHRREAAEAYRAALRLAPGRAELHLGLANELAANPDSRDASVVQYREAIRLNPQLVEAYNNLGALLSGVAAERGEALQLLTQAVQLAPDYADARFNLAMLLVRIPERRDDALLQLREAVRLRPDDQQARAVLEAMLAIEAKGGSN